MGARLVSLALLSLSFPLSSSNSNMTSSSPVRRNPPAVSSVPSEDTWIHSVGSQALGSDSVAKNFILVENCMLVLDLLCKYLFDIKWLQRVCLCVQFLFLS